jgi:hypothetical protein
MNATVFTSPRTLVVASDHFDVCGTDKTVELHVIVDNSAHRCFITSLTDYGSNGDTVKSGYSQHVFDSLAAGIESFNMRNPLI